MTVRYCAGVGVQTGNPHGQLVEKLMSRGVHVELCGATARVHGYANEDLIPRIKVNADAMARTTQQGYVKITEGQVPSMRGALESRHT